MVLIKYYNIRGYKPYKCIIPGHFSFILVNSTCNHLMYIQMKKGKAYVLLFVRLSFFLGIKVVPFRVCLQNRYSKLLFL